MSNIQALVDALTEIVEIRNKPSYTDSLPLRYSKIGQIAEQALADYHKSQKEGVKVDPSCADSEEQYELMKKEFDIPSDSTSDVTSLASHSSTPTTTLDSDEVFKALSDLVNLKNYKEAYGKTPEYEEKQPKVWEAARQAILKKQK